MSPAHLSDDELTRFGIVADDEWPHPYSPEHESWNESWFWDWFDADGERAGHVRIGMLPNQGRAWVWFLLYQRGEWLVLEQPRLPLDDVRPTDLGYDGWGLHVSWEVADPLRAGRLRCAGFGRAVTGPRAGMVVPMAVDLAVEAVGPAFSHGAGEVEVPGHSAQGYATNRFEQPTVVRGSVVFGDDEAPFEGRGERDHSWGPRDWDIEWTFFAVQGDDVRTQWAEVDIPGFGRIAAGYLLGATAQQITAVDADLTFAPDDALRPVRGRFTVTAADGTTLGAAVESVSGVEIDLSHCLTPPRPTTYRRALVRVTPDGGRPTLGWMEYHRLDRDPTDRKEPDDATMR